MNKIIIATNNQGKVKDFETLFQPLGYEVLSLRDFPEVIEPEETGVTFEENALIKATSVMEQLQYPVISDDSGLEVDALNKEPGVYSARYAGEEKDDEANLQKVLQNLKDVVDPLRTARYVCVLAGAVPGKEPFTVRGECEGVITREKMGTEGFGYDPIFYVSEKQKTMAQLSKEEKNKISHRHYALEKLVQVWDEESFQ
ncbi:XTP/dITP diphosphatase [Massilibacterium senegalense]|uniref:XTP/dITP diphosphatase n=1 Tax=Massilibacterium senegalense TaxID=1632858 RepID=UPI000782C016|nr:XTP/dITP diphosphatase [Massilibacterium senegalense]